ncbi:TonB-dependent receptor [Paraglaciecola sp. 2405UD69-4]|uniref:TonB-dependent receptor n=1 Tax=Paraglaciecola sp. 2405UD69-4 TaxID=3391836 RepID=UPI0039C9DE30
MHGLPLQLTIFLMACVFCSTSVAQEIKINGFVAQGVIKAEDSNYVEDDGGLSLKLTEVGLNSSYRFNSKFRVAGQLVYLDGGNRYQQGARVDYLFLESQFYDSDQWSIKAQLGRNKNYHWLYSATRDVPHTRPSIILPQSLYIDVFRDVALGVDGIALIGQGNNNLGEWDINLSYGKSPISAEQKVNLLGHGAKGKLKHDFEKQFSVYWRPNLNGLQFGVSLLDADFSYFQGENDTLVDGQETSQRITFNTLYQESNYELAFEVMRERVIIQDVLSSNFYSDTFGEGGFIQWRYFSSNKFTWMARLDVYDRDIEDRNGNLLNATSQGTVPSYFGYADQATLGLSWNYSKSFQIQTEFHRVKGAARLAPIFTPNTLVNNSEYWNIWAVQAMYWF